MMRNTCLKRKFLRISRVGYPRN